MCGPIKAIIATPILCHLFSHLSEKRSAHFAFWHGLVGRKTLPLATIISCLQVWAPCRLRADEHLSLDQTIHTDPCGIRITAQLVLVDEILP